MNEYIGSEWRKWDLHVHTPDSVVHDYKSSQDEDIWEKFINELEKLPEDIKVIGINDYLFLDGYKKVIEFKNKNRLKNIDLILPIIEFRLKEFVGHTKLGRINYHIVFSDKLLTDTIEQQFLTQLYGNAKLDPNESSITWGGALSKQSLIDLGKQIKETTPAGTSFPNGSDLEVGFNNINFELSKIEELLNNPYLNDSYIKAIGKTEWDDFRWDGSTADKKSLINGCGFVFIASPTLDKSIASRKKLQESEVNSRVLHCSDAHQFFETNYTSKILGHCYTWIKSDTTFEGLKQVIYEPEARLKLSDNKPQPPLHKLEKINLLFDNDTKWGNDRFCFAGFTNEIIFSPNLTCIIGGRGSGKSTLLNLIAKKIGSNSNHLDNVKPLNIDSNITFTPESISDIEFLAQNTIEKFATDKKEFTNAIYTRLNKKSNFELEHKENETQQKLKIFDNQIELLKQQEQFIFDIEKLKQDYSVNNNIVKTLSDKEYIKNKKTLDDLQKQINVINKSRDKYKNLYERIEFISKEYTSISDENNNYDTHYNELVKDIGSLFKKYQDKDYSSDKEKLKKLNENILMQENAIEQYLKDKGLSEENIQDAKNASQMLISLKTKREDKLCELKTIKRNIRAFNMDDIDHNIGNFETLINNELEKINQLFKKISEENPSEVKLIEVRYEPSLEIYQRVFNSFKSILDIQSFNSTSWDYLKSILIEEVLEFKSGQELLNKIGERNTQAYSALESIFTDEINFIIYKLLIEKEKRNISDNKNLRVFYDNKPLDNSSFGQKCTAAIVILLSLGNNPIIIDEPEAHLDSSLIANYLVELIKQQKENRQIIFATHNANFVLNADAELIIKLENTNNSTTIKYLTIEDIDNRDELLKLEGGKEAFQKRERKYNL